MKITHCLYQSFPIKDWFMFTLNIAESAILSVLYGIIIEFTFVILDEIIRSEKPFNYELTNLYNRLRAGEQVLRLMGNLTVFYTIFIIIGLYTLNTFYLFNWLFYSRISALLLLVVILTTLAIFERRVQKEGAYLLWKVDKGLEVLFNKIDSGEQINNDHILSLIAFRKQIVDTGKIPWNWRQIFLIGASILFLLSQPYLYKAIFL